MVKKSTGTRIKTTARKTFSGANWQADSGAGDGHPRSFIPVALYLARQRVLATPFKMDGLLAQECRRTLAAMLNGKDRLYDVNSTRSAQRNSRQYVAARDIIKVVDAFAQRALMQSRTALGALPALGQQHGGWFSIDNKWPAVPDADQMLDRLKQFSLPYLNWIAHVRQANPKVQAALRLFLDSEFHLHRISEDQDLLRTAVDSGDEVPGNVVSARDELERKRAALSQPVQRLLELRSKNMEVTSIAFDVEMVGVHPDDTRPYAAWPFPPRLSGSENGEELSAAVESCLVLGRWMQGCGANLQFFGLPTTGESVARREQRSLAGEEEAQALWRQVHEAGEVLDYLGAALRALIRLEPVAHCALCYRHVDDGLRKYCRLHARRELSVAPVEPNAAEANGPTNPHPFTQHRQSRILAARFNGKYAELVQQVQGLPLWSNPELVLEQQLGKFRRKTGRQPFEMGRTLEQRSADLRLILDVFLPVTGPALHARMVALLEKMTAWVSQCGPAAADATRTLAAAELALQKRSTTAQNEWNALKHPVYLGSALSEDDAYWNEMTRFMNQKCTVQRRALAHARATGQLPIAQFATRMESLTGAGYFANWFSGFSETRDASGEMHEGVDPNHPMTIWRPIPSGKFNAPLRRTSSLDIGMVLRDLLMHRAWTEVGGERADSALQTGGAPLPGLKPKGRVNLAVARQMRNEAGMSYEAIGKTFGVSRAAVYLALKRANMDGAV